MSQQRFDVISQLQAQELLQEYNGTKDPELSARTCDEAYQLADGRVVMNIPDIESWVFASREEMLAYLEETQKPTYVIDSEPQVFPSLSELLTQGKNFITQEPKLIDDLALKLSIPKAELNKSEESLAKVDQAVKRIGLRNCLNPEIFQPLTAYIGEIVKQKTDGEWEMRLESDGETWMPWIVDARGQYYSLSYELYNELIVRSTDYFFLENVVSAIILRSGYDNY